MSEAQQGWWDAERPNRTIIGLSEGPWDVDELFNWPTDGYDGFLTNYQAERTPGTPGRSGRPVSDWLELTDHMIQRWQAFREHLLTLPPVRNL